MRPSPRIAVALATAMLALPFRGSAAQDPAPSDTLHATPADSAAGVRVCAGGDVTLGTNLDPAWARLAAARLRSNWGRSDDPFALVEPLRALVGDADIVLVNVEGAIGSGPAPSKCGPKSTNCFAFRSPTAAAAALRSLAAPDRDVVGNVANNHARDAGTAGFHATRRHLEAASVHVTGADTLATPVATASGDTVAFLGFYTSRESPDARDLAAVRRHVRRAAQRWPLVVVTAHIGGEGRGAQRTRDATEIFLGTIDRGNPVAFARTAVEAGASLVVGHGPHVLRAAEWYGDRLAFHSLGNLLTYGPFGNREPTSRGGVACVILGRDGGVMDAELRSTRQLAPGVLVPDDTHRGAFLVDSLGRVDFPRTAVRLDPVGRVLPRERDGTGAVPSRAGQPRVIRGERGKRGPRR